MWFRSSKSVPAATILRQRHEARGRSDNLALPIATDGLKRRQTADAGADYDRRLLAARALANWYDEVTVQDNYERQTGLQK
jgi:hypothetical protein